MAFFKAQQQPAAIPDIELANPPPDSISSISFSPTADLLAVGSWDCSVRIYEVNAQGQSQGKAMYSHEGPVLDVCWSKDGTKIFSGGADGVARMYDLQTGASQQVGAHDGPVKCVRWIGTGGGILITGSWDKTVKYWNTNIISPNPMGILRLPERVYAMDVAQQLLAVATAERKICLVNLAQPDTIFREVESPLKWQTRTLACSPAGDGYAIGGVEGRVAVQYVDEKDSANNMSFKCHRKDTANPRDGTTVHSVNAISFNVRHGTFSTCGSDGAVCFWDKDSRIRLKSFEPAPGPIACTAINRTGTIFAYAVSYDWSKGHTGMTPGHVNKVMLHPLKDEEMRRKPKK
ncbi:hypothetical protein FRB94_005083 [Tulasnella sp. JGI-2019a]|nr:hypothetical protein FRB94_005083 [Tulasnella sp. JGI-2019a]KAG9008712.1 hypothetical protein FRB93_006258 [Tulasnella sp. JGI-2019a]KAG9032566.1 hypothetical protein FRB95_001231 [Tulasnella sp. JGI-2019a]